MCTCRVPHSIVTFMYQSTEVVVCVYVVASIAVGCKESHDQILGRP